MSARSPFRVICLLAVFPFIAIHAVAIPSFYGEFSSGDYSEYSRCSQCHAILRSQWDGSMHAHAFTDPFYRAELKLASEDTGGALDEFCVRCHAPVAVLSAEIPPVDGSQAGDVSLQGVGCDFCHTVSGSDGVGNGSFVSSPGNVKYGPFDDSKSAYHDCEYLELCTQAEYCGMCHQIYHPDNGLVLDDTYTSWKASPYAESGVTCQDCHMTPGITGFKANPGRSGSGAPKRDHISIHYFSGANVFMSDILGEEENSDRAEQRLRKAATLNVTLPETAEAGETVNLKVGITNSGAGHKLPTGLIEAREMWLQIMVSDSAGQILLDSGTPDADGDPGDAVVYRTVFADPDGEPTLKLWEASSVISDNRIAPKETALENFSFVLPENAADPILVDVKLLYRSASQSMIDEVFGDGVYAVPVVEMVSRREAINGEVPAESTPGFGVMISVFSVFSAVLYHRREKGK